MGSKERRTALKAASAYYGFSSNENALPDSVDVSVNTVLDRDGGSPFLDELEDVLRKAWPENVGQISRTARLGDRDFAYYVNRLRDKKGQSPVAHDDPEVRDAMEHFVGDGVCLVEIDRNGDAKTLLVNTQMSP